jgi:hypothetical protein
MIRAFILYILAINNYFDWRQLIAFLIAVAIFPFLKCSALFTQQCRLPWGKGHDLFKHFMVNTLSFIRLGIDLLTINGKGI